MIAFLIILFQSCIAIIGVFLGLLILGVITGIVITVLDEKNYWVQRFYEERGRLPISNKELDGFICDFKKAV